MKKVTLGGDRLGSGAKMEVELHNYERSTHDLGNLFRTTMSPGTLVPFMVRLLLPADTFDIKINCNVKTHPTVGPLFGSYKVQLDTFTAPIRLYQGQLHNNKLGIGLNMASIKLPQIRLTASELPADLTLVKDIDNAQINPSAIWAYLGIRGIGIIDNAEVTPIVRDFNGIPFLAYWDIYKNYYANKQEKIGAVIHTPASTIVTTINDITFDSETIPTPPAPPENIPATSNELIIVNFTGTVPIPRQIIFDTSQGPLSLEQLGEAFTNTSTQMFAQYKYWQYGTINIYNWRYISNIDLATIPPQVVTFPLENIDKMREKILAETETPTAFIINEHVLTPYDWAANWENSQSPYTRSQEGLAIKTYQSDLFNNWLDTEDIDGAGGINEITAIDTSGGSFTIDTLNLAKKVYDMLNRIAASGGTYDDWLDVNWMNNRITRAESPIYHGGLSKELVFQEVVSNSESTGQAGPVQPLGTLAGKGVMADKHKGGNITIHNDEPSYLIGLISLTPRIDYSQGNTWDTSLKTMDDIHKPALDQIGFQDLITEQMAWWTTVKPLAGIFTQKSAGKQPAWINYMTSTNKVLGNFAIGSGKVLGEMFMTLNRRYEPNATFTDINDLTTYIDPVKFNHIFAHTAIDAQNFWVQISIDVTARRKMSAKIMPNL